MDDTSQIALFSVLFALGLVSILVAPGIKFGLNLADEAYLHFGSVRVLKGEIPIRDFRAYDPGRYYWCAFWMRLLGPTFTAQRVAMAIIIAMTLSLMCFFLVSAGKNWSIGIVGTLISYVWVRPYFKAFEIFFSLIAVLLPIFIFSSEFPNGFLYSGLLAGAVLLIGLNVAVYAGLIAFLSIGVGFYAGLFHASMLPFFWLFLGSILGTLPYLVYTLINRGFAAKYLDMKVFTILKRGSSNLPLPIPWLWTDAPQFRGFPPLKKVFFKSWFTFLLPFYFLSIWLGIFDLGLDSITGRFVTSAGLVGTVYAHHLYSRADVSHLCQTIHPALLLLSLLLGIYLSIQWAVIALVIFLVLSVWAFAPVTPVGFGFQMQGQNMKTFDFGQEQLKLPTGQSRLLKKLKTVIDSTSNPKDFAFFAPTVPGYYELFERRPVVYDIFCVYPETSERQLEMINEMELRNMAVSVVLDRPIDFNDERRFSKTHPLIWDFLNSNYEQLDIEGLPKDLRIFAKR